MEGAVKVCKGLSEPRGVCVKVASLHPRFENLKEWVEASPKHVLVTRRGRVFLDRTTVYQYAESEWANPFPVGKKKHTLEQSLQMFEAHLAKLLEDAEKRERFVAMMSGAAEIGCFCAPGARCHRDVLIRVYREFSSGDDAAANVSR
jgi:hypothetical protein